MTLMGPVNSGLINWGRAHMNYIGCGIGLRPQYVKDVLERKSKSDWFEVITENLLPIPGFGRGKAFHNVMKIRTEYPMVLHGVSLNIGSSDPLSFDYLKSIKELYSIVQPEWVSDHICWTGVNNINLHDLLPLPYTKESLQHVANRINEVQDYLDRSMVFENASAYIDYRVTEMPEWVFLTELTKRTGCKLLVDINNIFVSSVNQNFDPFEYLSSLPKEAVKQIHLAGPTDKGSFLIDTHDQSVRDEVWVLYERALQLYGPRSTLIERDGNFPPLAELELEQQRAKKMCEKTYFSKGDLNEITL